MVTDEMVEAAFKVFSDKMLMREEDKELIGRVLEAALSTDAEPTLWVSTVDLRAWQRAKAGEIWAWPENLEGQCIPLYAAPPAPSVAVKALEWNERPILGGTGYFAETPALICYAIKKYGDEYLLAVNGTRFNTYPKIRDAKDAAQSHYNVQIQSALSAQVQNDEDNRVAISLGAAALSKIVDPAAREIAIRNALIAASNGSGQVQAMAVAEIVSAHGDPEAFGERELVALVDIQKFPYRTKLYAAAPAKQEG